MSAGIKTATSDTIALREATEKDARLLFAWLNQTDSLAGKLATEQPVPWEEHRRWYRKRLQLRNCFIYIIEMDGHPCGQIRFEDKGEGLEIDIYLQCEHRRTGVAETALQQGLGRVARGDSAQKLIARVLKTNEISAAFFVKSGFTEIAEVSGTRVFTFNLPPKEAS